MTGQKEKQFNPGVNRLLVGCPPPPCPRGFQGGLGGTEYIDLELSVQCLIDRFGNNLHRLLGTAISITAYIICLSYTSCALNSDLNI